MVSESESMTSDNVKSESPLHQEESMKDISFTSLDKQNSFFSLTLDEIQCKSGKSFGSMNMDEFLNNVWNAEGNQASPPSNQSQPANDKSIANNQPTLPHQSSSPIPTSLCNKTVDEVWLEIHKDQQPQQQNLRNITHEPSQPRQQTFGEMTLEDFLVKAGVVQKSSAGSTSWHRDLLAPSQNQFGNFPNNGSCQEANYGVGHAAGVGLSDQQNVGNNLSNNGSATAYQMFGQSNRCIGESSNNAGNEKCVNALELAGQNSKKGKTGGPAEVVVERRQRRMIRNRESAARSRARKQAYTVELEVELDQLKEENAKLKQALEEAQKKRREEQQVMREKLPSTKSQKAPITSRPRMANTIGFKHISNQFSAPNGAEAPLSST
ncbi:hypothetical protein L1049_013852 [Liquidambar formosana]|uniref:BZIP domain-containing protein n=1 Tax=Liquidambar formosana TaxID=63359 RepID=A0AAP0WZ33_LIQFO